jgi:hypothetical protein
MSQTTGTDQLRERAVERLRKKRAFYAHLLVYTIVNSAIVMIWVLTTPGHFFWPVFPMLFWGVGVVMNAGDVWRGDITEDDIEREIHKLSHHA